MAAKTSLARQLELLKLPQTSAHKETHGSASFLYGFLEAKNIDADTHYSVACIGLEGLIKIDPYIETFKETLFHESSKKFDRGLTVKETNEKIDLIIEEFLFRVVSKYFQLSDAHKTIEWLIYRYKVNEYNVDALIGSVLPYHETRQFVRLLQTCPAVKNPHSTRWYWLKTIQEKGLPLAKSVLLQHCLSNVEFIRFITDSVFKAIQIDGENEIFPSFLVSFCLNLLERSTNEMTFSMITSALSKSLRMKNQSLYIASYVIFSHLCSVTKLDLPVVEKILKSFVRKIKIDLCEGALVAFNIVCHTQDVKTLPVEFLNDELIDQLATYSNTHNLQHLLRCYLHSIVFYADQNSTNETLLETYKGYIDKLLPVVSAVPVIEEPETIADRALTKRRHADLEFPAQPDPLSSAIDALHKNLLDNIDSNNEDIAIQLVSSFLRLQLELSESGASRSTVNNRALINTIKKQLSKFTTDGMFSVHLLQHLMPIEEIYDTFAYTKKAPAEKRAKLDTSPQSERVSRVSTSIEADSKFAIGWKLLRIYVELFPSKNNLLNVSPLLKSLFEYLKLTFMEVDDNSNEFTRKAILNVIVNCIELRLSKKETTLKQANGEKNAEQMEIDQSEEDPQELAEFLNNIDVDIIIDCMRESRLKDTQKMALLLIRLIAPHFQKQILDYLVSIFTFIGTSFLQCDDNYSLAILFETMESIIPIILQNDSPDLLKEHTGMDKKQYILSVFVKSFSDIRSYRRLALFTKLVQLLGEDQFLPIVVVRLLEEACLLKTKTSRSEKEVWISFLQQLFLQFPPTVVLSSLCTLLCLFERKFFDYHLKKKSLQKQLTYASNLKANPQQQEEFNSALSTVKALSESVCKDFSTKITYDSDKLACGVEILRFIVLVISDKKFSQNAVLMADSSQSCLLIHLLNLILELIVTLGPGDSSMKMSLNVYRKRIKSTLDDMLLKYNSLLPPKRLIQIVIDDLLKNSGQFDGNLANLIQRKALELLNEKLNTLGAHEVDPKLCLRLVRSLNKHLTFDSEQVNKLSEQQIHNIQLMMLSLKFCIKFLEPNLTHEKVTSYLTDALEHIYKLATSITINLSEGETSARVKSLQNLKSSCILCITQILCTMSLEGIQHLSNVVELILEHFQIEDDIVLISNVSALSKIIIKFPEFLSPHLKPIILRLLYAYTQCDKIANLRSKLQAVWSNLAKSVPKRVLFEAIDASYEEATQLSPHSVIELMALFKLSCDTLEKSDVEVIAKSLKNFMIKALSYRSTHSGEVSLQTIEQLEGSFGEAFSAFIPKLTEATFRPIFFRLLEWSMQFESLKTLDEEGNCVILPNECYSRMIAFYRFCSLLADRLKSLFCVFVAPSILNNCSEMLLAYNSHNSEDAEEEGDQFVSTVKPVKTKKEARLKLKDQSLGEPLIAAILATLSKCFLYDLNGSFVNKDCISLIVKPIVNQISNLFGSEADFETRLDLILQCTQFFIQNNKEETLIKEFNYQILLKTRDSNEKVRAGAIKVLHRLILTCSEDYLPFIPESIPFIAELSEDESELVESYVKKLIIDIEQLVGEPINKYL